MLASFVNQALEPELHRLIAQNRQQIKESKVEGQKRLAELKLTLEREMEAAIRDAGRVLEADMTKELELAKSQQENKIAELVQRHEQEARESREEGRRMMEGERVRFEADRRRLMELHTEEIEAVTRAVRDRVKAGMEAQEDELVQLSVKHSRDMEDVKRALLLETEQDRKEVVARLQAELHAHKESVLASIRRQHAGELESVLTRLKREQREEHAALESKHETALQKMRREHGEEKEVLVRRRDLAKEKAARTTEAAVLEESNVSKMESELDELETRIIEVEGDMARERRDMEVFRETASSRGRDLSQELKDVLALFQEQKDALNLEVRAWSIRGSEAQARAEVEVGEYQHEKNAALIQVQEKVDQILSRRNDLLKSLTSQLTSLQALNRDKEMDLERYRRLNYT